MKIQSPPSSELHDAGDDATAQPSRRAVMVLIAVIAIAAGWTTGFFSGATLTKPNRQQVDAEISEIKAQNARLTADIERMRWNAADHEFSQTVLNPELRTNLRTVIECSEDYARVLIFDSLRAAIAAGKNPDKFQFALECSVKVLDDLLATIAARPPTEDEALRDCRKLIITAGGLEKQVQLGFIEIMQGKTDGTPAAKELSEQLSEAYWAALRELVIQRKRFGLLE